jgi:hypothetical protein
MALNNLEARTESLSGCAEGEALEITGTTWNAPTVIHDMTVDDVIDCVWLKVCNTTGAAVTLNLILNPNDSDTQADVDASTFQISIPANDTRQVLDGDRFRLHTNVNNTETIAAYSAVSGELIVHGHCVRLEQDDLTI